MAVHPSRLIPSFDVAVGDHGTTRTISLTDEIDIAALPAFKAAVEEAFSEPGCETLVIDLSAASFIETRGVTVLYDAHLRSSPDGTRLVLIPATAPGVQRAIALCGLSEHLPFAA